MEAQELKQLIKKDRIPNFLIFVGDEWMVKKLYIEQISKVRKLGIKYDDAVSEIKLGSKSLLSNNYIYVVYDDKEFMTEEKLQQKTLDNLNNDMLILVLTSVDKRLKFVKTYKDIMVEFNELGESILKKYIKKVIYNLSDRNCEILIEACDNNYGHCLIELDKIICYWESINKGTVTIDENEVFKKLLEDGTIHLPPKESLWDFIKAVLKDRPKLAYDLYLDLKELEAPTLSMLSNLYNSTKQVLQVQTCHSNDIAKTTGLTAWQIRNAQECVGIWGAGDLVYLMRLIQQTEADIKRGNIEEEIAMDYVLTNFFM